MRSNGNELQVQDRLGECRDMVVAGWGKSEIIAAVAVLLPVVALVTRWIRRSYAVKKKWIMGVD